MIIDLSGAEFKRNWKSVQLPALAPFLLDVEIRRILDELAHRCRNTGSDFTPAGVVWSMVHRAVHPDHSIRNTVEHLAAASIEISPSGWCQARSRLPDSLFPRLNSLTAGKAIDRFGSSYLWHGRHIFLTDGTGVSMPDTPELVQAFGYKQGKYGPSRFPSANVVCILHAGVHVVFDFRVGGPASSELALWREMIPSLPKGCILVVDRLFCTIPDIVLLSRREIDIVTKLHALRAPDALIREGRRIGQDEWIVPFHLSGCTDRSNADLHLPKTIEVRLIRHKYRHNGKRRTAWLVTTLLDASKYPKLEVVALYRSRWGIETHINYLKTPLSMGVLRSMTPASVRSEIGAIILAHNLLWSFMCETSVQSGRSVRRLSFAAAIKTVLHSANSIRLAAPRLRQSLFSKAMCRLARQPNPYRPGRIEPRLLKREKAGYAYLRTSRAEARKAC